MKWRHSIRINQLPKIFPTSIIINFKKEERSLDELVAGHQQPIPRIDRINHQIRTKNKNSGIIYLLKNWEHLEMLGQDKGLKGNL